MEEFILETRNLSIGYHSRAARMALAAGLNLGLRPGRLTGLIGPNGCGKTTLLRTLAGLLKALDGEICIAGRPMQTLAAQELARKVGVVLTETVHPGDLRVNQVVELGRLPYSDWLGRLTALDRAVVEQSLRRVGALDLAGRCFGELSDGERQKVMVARALAQDPLLIILDEPTAYLDWPNRVDLLENLKQISVESGKTILFSSHDLDLVLQLSDEIWLLDRERKITCGPPRELIKNGGLEKTFAGKYRVYLPRL